jgi:ADP-heptose:LPS heptosyltransferase
MKLIPEFGRRESPVSNFLKLLINIARLIVDAVARLCSFRMGHGQQPNSPKKRLLILRPGAIGDVVILSGILPYIRKLHPENEWEITLLAGGGAEHLADFFKHRVLGVEKAFDFFIGINARKFSYNLWYRFCFQMEISKIKYDVVLCPTFPRLKDDSQLLFILKARQKFGSGLDDNFLKVKRNNNSPHTTLFEALPGWTKETDRNAHFMKMLGCSPEIDGVPRWQIPPEERDRAKLRVANLGIQTPIAVICPGAAFDFREWPAVKMAAAIDYLWGTYGITAVICGSSADRGISERIQSHVNVARPIDLCGQTNLIDLAALISIAKLAISMDSGPAHLAVAVNTPLVCIIGGGHYRRFFPYGNPHIFRAATEELDCFYCDWTCKFARPICVENISVERVLKEVDLLLNATVAAQVEEC